MMPPAVLGYLNAALSILPLLIQAGQDVAAWVSDLRSVANAKSDPTDADWATLDARMRDALAKLKAASTPQA